MDKKTDKSVTDTSELMVAAQAAQQKGPPPVHLWNPPYCGEMDLEIRSDGTWFHNGTPINRPRMVQLFSSILKLEDGRFYLVTPVEKIGIRVQDAPFVAVDVDFTDAGAVFTTNVAETVIAGPDHAIRIAGTPDRPRPYLHIRRGLEALIDRKTYYRLAEAAQTGPDGKLSLRSGQHWLALEA